MASIREQIVDEIVATLNAGSPPVVAKRSYQFAVDLAVAKSIIVFPRVDSPESIGIVEAGVKPTKRRLTVAVECRAKGTNTQRADEEVDALAVWVVKTLCGRRKGPGDAGGPLYHYMIEGDTEFELDQLDHAYCLATVNVTVQYQSRANDPETWA